MKEGDIWIWNDKEDNLWKFRVNKNGDFIYQIMYTDEKWTNENKIDEKVLEFNIKIDKEENIHVIYVQEEELKYCIYNKEKWFGKTIYKFDYKQVKISELDLVILGDYINVFFILINKTTPLKGELIHYAWNEYEGMENNIFNINIMKDAHNHYSIEITEKNEIYLFFISYNKDKSDMNMSIFRNNIWISEQVLYSIKGEKIKFFTLNSQDGIHILNLSKEINIYVLEHVYLCFNGEMIYHKIIESDLSIIEPILLEVDEVIWCIWNMGKETVCSFFNEQWEGFFKLANKEELLVYNGFFKSINNKKIKAYRLWGTNSSPIRFILPDSFLQEPKSSEDNLEEKYIQSNIYIQMEEMQKRNKSLEKSLVNLQLQLQQKQRLYDELENRLFNAINKSRKAEEKCNVFKKAHEQSQEKLNETNIKLQELNEALQITNEEKLEIINMFKEANEEIKNLKESLEEEMNKSIIEKIFSRKSEV
ncbi:hypothetical protein [Clostridium cochlearium]|uniref:Uncharacterized protein n=1 Tax=Clostridium cochlearium TaxID=1494 RepID=A0A2X2VYM1_CLOCO|nr:hypothetical protein [Clostridium cochlearium]MBE6065719.1 hypothetical protein [Clostridium cochlearium]MBU5270549.1 hypothetical protein [Clostridium cochlearium]SQB34206.1 Uncharacterised protein [Clostridium cochlearium]